MHKKNRRSSMKKKSSEDEDTTVNSTSKSKRISFSGKKSVRVFREDVIIASKPYDNSYEESDHAGNGSGEMDTLGHNIVNVHQKRIALRSRVVVAPETNNFSSGNRKVQSKNETLKNVTEEEEKENYIQICQSTAHQTQIKILQSELKSSAASSTYYRYQKPCNKTMDFINNTQGSESTIHIESSVDVTPTNQEVCRGIVSNEKHNTTPLITNDPRSSISFSVEDNEVKMFELKTNDKQILQNIKKITNPNATIVDGENTMLLPLVREIQKIRINTENEKSLLANKTNAASVSVDLYEEEFEEVEKIPKCSRKTVYDVENMKESFLMNDPSIRKSEVFSIHMDESIKNKINTNSNDLRRKTLKKNYDMEISRIYEFQNKENLHENLRRKTIINDDQMDISEIDYIENNENIHNDLRRKTVNHFENMELSCIEPIKSREHTLQQNARNATKINELADCTIETNSFKLDIPDISKIDHIQNNENIHKDLRRKTVNQFENMELSGIEPIEIRENKLQLNARNTTKINELADCSIEINSFKLDIPDDVKKATSNFNEKLNRISLKEELSDEIFKSTILSQPKQKEQEDQNTCEMEISIDMEDIETSNKFSKQVLQKTIHFNDFSKNLDDKDLETSCTSHLSALNSMPANKRKTIVFNNEECVELDVSKCNPLPKTASEVLSSVNANEKEPEPSKQLIVSSKTGAIPKVIRKTCATKPKQEKVADLQFERYQRYQNRQKENVSNEAKERMPVCTNLNQTKLMPFSTEKSFMSPESQSLFPPHCQQYGSSRKINFRQLNEEIESGKLQLFPDAEKMPNNKQRNNKITTKTIHEKEERTFDSKIQSEYKMEIEETSISTESAKQTSTKRQTLLMPSDMELEEPPVEHEAENKNHHTTKKTDSIKPLNLAKHILQKECVIPNLNTHSQEDSFDVILKEAREAAIHRGNNNSSLSPLPNTGDQEEHLRRLCEGTPHRSVLEFEYHEKETKNESNKDTIYITDSFVLPETENSKHSALKKMPVKVSIIQDNAQKRNTSNLTPNLSVAKKRHTELFNDYDIEEQLPQQSDVMDISKNTNTSELLSKRKTLLYRETITVENADSPKHRSILLPQAMEVVDNTLIVDESYCKTPIKTNSLSRIPILIESAKKNSSIKKRSYSPPKASVSEISRTIEIPRFIISKDLDQSVYVVEPFTSDGGEEKLQCLQQAFEDNPITISDVSAHYLAVKQNSTLKNVIFNEKEEDTQSNAKTLRKFVDMTFESPVLCSETDDIDETRISLVGTLLDEDDSDDDNNDYKAAIKNIEILHVTDNTIKDITKPALNIKSVCRNCKRCQNTIGSEETLNITDSFVLPEMPPLPDLGIESLDRLRAKPTIDETLEYWRRVHLAADTCRSSENYDDESEEDVEFDKMLKETEEKADRLLKAFDDKMRLLEKFEQRKPFYERWHIRVRKLLPNLIYNYQMVIRNFCQFDHRKIITVALIVVFEPKDPLRKDVIIKCLKLQPSRVPCGRWHPIDFILDFQLRLDLPYNVNQLYHNNGNVDDDIYNALEEFDKVCVRVHELGMRFWKTVCREHATLIRGTHNTYVQKVVRKLIPPNENNKFSQIQRTIFKIEIRNIRKISFKDIVLPQLHLFREDLENLPIGLEFLSVFLRDPASYLKE